MITKQEKNMKDGRVSCLAFQRRLKQCMAEQNINATQLSRRLGVERKTIYSYYNGLSEPTIYTILALCDIFHVSADWLIGRK